MEYDLNHPEIRQAVRRLCSDFDGKYWQTCDKKRSYPQEFVLALTNAGYLSALIPEKFGNGHLVTSDEAIFHYKQNTYYNPSGQFTILWNDPSYKFEWPIKTPILSSRDEKGCF